MNILVIDDHALFREGLSFILNALADDVTIYTEPNCEQALHLMETNSELDLVLMDLQ